MGPGGRLRKLGGAALSVVLLFAAAAETDAQNSYIFAGQWHNRYDGVVTNGVGGYIRFSVLGHMNSTGDHVDEIVRLDCNCGNGTAYGSTWVEIGRVQGWLDATHNFPNSGPSFYEYNYCNGTSGGYGDGALGVPPQPDYPVYVYFLQDHIQLTCAGSVVQASRFAFAVGSVTNIVAYGYYYDSGGSETALYPLAQQEISYCCTPEQIGQNRWGLDPNGNPGSQYHLILDNNGSWYDWTPTSSPGTNEFADSPLWYCNSHDAWRWTAFKVQEASC